jgi:hypothetical protein
MAAAPVAAIVTRGRSRKVPVLYLIAGTDDVVADGGIGLPQLAARRSAVLWHACRPLHHGLVGGRIYDGPGGLARG